MVSYLTRMDTGYAGDMSREPGPGDITQEVLDPTVDWSTVGFGTAVVIGGTGFLTPVSSGSAAADITGMLVRSYPGRAVSNTGDAAYPQINGGAVDVAKRGYMTVPLQNSTPAKKSGLVYIRVAGGTSALAVGGIEAAADGTNTILLPGGRFEGPAGADGITEISFNVQ